jgi:hypothetical protein
MPFDAGFTNVYAAIQQAAVNCGLLSRGADEIWEAPGVIQDVVNLIDRARIVVCDCTCGSACKPIARRYGVPVRRLFTFGIPRCFSFLP